LNNTLLISGIFLPSWENTEAAIKQAVSEFAKGLLYELIKACFSILKCL